MRRCSADIETEAQCGALLALRLVEEFRIDLGFDLRGDAAAADLAVPQPVRAPHTLTAQERRLLIALQEGLPLAPRPFAVLGDAAGIGEAEVLEQIRQWTAAGLIRRLGVIVRHRELGYRANAMVVWDVPDTLVRPLGINLAQQAGVTLCYRRTRARPRWDYNLYCMIHGKSREVVLSGSTVSRRAPGSAGLSAPDPVQPHALQADRRALRARQGAGLWLRCAPACALRRLAAARTPPRAGSHHPAGCAAPLLGQEGSTPDGQECGASASDANRA